jgi:flavodoxin
MSVLVVYASKHGATKGIAERIAETLTAAGQEAEARPVRAAGELAGHEAVVVGSAVYMRHWMEEACEFVRRNRTPLADRPVWLFSSGPLGSWADLVCGAVLISAKSAGLTDGLANINAYLERLAASRSRASTATSSSTSPSTAAPL